MLTVRVTGYPEAIKFEEEMKFRQQMQAALFPPTISAPVPPPRIGHWVQPPQLPLKLENKMWEYLKSCPDFIIGDLCYIPLQPVIKPQFKYF